MKFSEFVNYQIGGFPLVGYLGIITFFCFLFTFLIPIINRSSQRKIPIKWHFLLAKITLTLAIIHGFLALAVYFE